MSLNQLKRTLHREFTRNPAKSAALLALLPVAGYFIGPLIWKQLPGGKKTGDKVSRPRFLAAAATDGAATPRDTPEAPGWQEIAHWISADVRMKPATVEIARDPFRARPLPGSSVAGAESQAGEQSPPAPSLRPEDCGLKLTATIVGPTRQLATISGRLYPRDARVPFDNAYTHARYSPTESTGTDDAFVLKSVAKDYVVLERNGEQFRLPIHGGGRGK